MSRPQPALLLLNREAGQAGKVSKQALVAALQTAGFEPQTHTTTQESQLDDLLRHAAGPVFVAGGDGSFRAAALRLLGRNDAPLGLIPMGTSNNIARTLGMNASPLEVAYAYAAAQIKPFDVGHVMAPWGEDFFFEACGCVLFADVLTAYDPDAPKSVLRGIQAVINTLPTFKPQDLHLQLNAQTPSAVSLTLLEFMNIQATGNGMRLAPKATPFDGLLDAIQVNPQGRERLLTSLLALLAGQFETLPEVEAQPIKTAQVSYFGQAFHVDGEIRQAKGCVGTVNISVLPAALQVLMPVKDEPNPVTPL